MRIDVVQRFTVKRIAELLSYERQGPSRNLFSPKKIPQKKTETVNR